MSIRKKIIIFLALIVCLVLLVVVVLFFTNKNKKIENTEENTTSTKTNVPVVDNNVKQIETLGEDNMFLISQSIEIDEEELYIKQLAGIFTERFNTYSNQNKNIHIEEVKDLVTDSMYNWIKTQKLAYSEDYIGLTSQVLSSQIVENTNQKAKVLLSLIQTSQKEVDGKINLEKDNIEVNVELVKENDTWLVSGFFK